jgi:hypothetical protein
MLHHHLPKITPPFLQIILYHLSASAQAKHPRRITEFENLKEAPSKPDTDFVIRKSSHTYKILFPLLI